MQGGYWWQEESRGKRAFRLLVELTVDLGRLPTIEEAREYDESLPSDAAYYYSSYDSLCREVAGRLYGNVYQTYPTEVVECNNRWAKRSTPEELQARYETRLKELDLKPKDPERLTKPAPLPEPLVETTPRKYKANSSRDDVLVTTTGKMINRWTGREVGYAARVTKSDQPAPRVTDSREESVSLDRADARSEAEDRGLIAVEAQMIVQDESLMVESDKASVSEPPLDVIDKALVLIEDSDKVPLTEAQTAVVLEVAQQVAEQVITQVVTETVVRSENTDKLDDGEVHTMKKVSAERCLEALRQAHAALGDGAFSGRTYGEYATKHGLPALMTMRKVLDATPREWRKFVENGNDSFEDESQAAKGTDELGATEEPMNASEGLLKPAEKVEEQEPVQQVPETTPVEEVACLNSAETDTHCHHNYQEDPEAVRELSEASRLMKEPAEDFGNAELPKSAFTSVVKPKDDAVHHVVTVTGSVRVEVVLRWDPDSSKSGA